MNSATEAETSGAWPSVTVVFLAYNRRDDLRLSLGKTLTELDYPGDLIDVIVVDNASSDGTAEMVEGEFPGVRLIRRAFNCGVSGFNDGFAAATGDYVLALDDDCHLPPEGLRRAVAEARREEADLVSFAVTSSRESTHRFDRDEYLTGLFSFWGCAVLMRRAILDDLGGYDPEIFVWANELEFTMRFFDSGFRHLHLPEVVAIHARVPDAWRPGAPFPERSFRLNARNWGYIAAKLLRPRDAVEALVALLVKHVRDGVKLHRAAFRGIPDTLRGFAHGLRHRAPVRHEVSRTYRRNFETFASPWWTSRTPVRIVRDAVFRRPAGSGYPGRRDAWLSKRARFYPAGWTHFDPDPAKRERVGAERSGVLQF
jgi:GT2 family glycosyltransferase